MAIMKMIESLKGLEIYFNIAGNVIQGHFTGNVTKEISTGEQIFETISKSGSILWIVKEQVDYIECGQWENGVKKLERFNPRKYI